MKKFNKHILKINDYLDEEDFERNLKKEKKLLVKAVNDYFDTYPKFNREDLKNLRRDLLEYINYLHEETEDYSKEELQVWFYTILKMLRTINNISYRNPREEPENVIEDFRKLVKSKFAKENYQGRKYTEELKS